MDYIYRWMNELFLVRWIQEAQMMKYDLKTDGTMEEKSMSKTFTKFTPNYNIAKFSIANWINLVCVKKLY